jgi:dienelactone hydrolase
MTAPTPLPIEALTDEVQLRDVRAVGGHIVWLERRGNRGVLVRWHGTPQDLTTGMNVGTTLGYGGGAFDLSTEFVVFVSGDVLWRQPLDAGPAHRITPASGKVASPVLSPDGRWVAYVHRENDTDRLGIVDALGGAWPSIAAQGADFYAQPAWSPAGDRLAWVEWDFPAMSWVSSRLMVGRHGDGRLTSVEQVAGSDGVGVYQPVFSPDGEALYFVDNEGETDRVVRLELASGAREVLFQGAIMEPGFAQGLRSMTLGPDGVLYVKTVEEGQAALVRLGPGGRSERLPLAGYGWLRQPAGDAEHLVAVAESPVRPPRVVLWQGAEWTVLRYASAERYREVLSRPSHVTIPGEHGEAIYGVLYPAVGGDASRPKAVINVHGGPTSMRGLSYEPLAQYLATRGYTVLLLNHRGSTGYGRAYREALDRRWGIVDVEDATSAADWLVREGLASEERVAIMGGSAGGYTTLMALATRPGTFGAGVSICGVADLLGMARRTHKLERRYLDILVGPLPEALPAYRDRSPVTLASAIRDPLCLFQGGQDEVVARSDADALVRELQRSGAEHRYTVYEDEGHGWSMPDTIADSYREIEVFLADSFG